MELTDLLKEETTRVHHLTEEKLGLLNPELTLNKYVEILSLFYTFYCSYEKELRVRPLPLMFLLQPKVPLLEKDLSYFKINKSTLPAFTNISLSKPESLIGMLYVMEGSSLGGQLLYKHFRNKFSLDVDNGLSFFFGLGEATFSQWMKFKRAINEAHQKNRWNEEQIIEAANNTFSLLGNHLGAQV